MMMTIDPVNFPKKLSGEVVEYRILSRFNIGVLEDVVNTNIANGFQPWGNLLLGSYAREDGVYEPIYVQVVVKTRERRKEDGD